MFSQVALSLNVQVIAIVGAKEKCGEWIILDQNDFSPTLELLFGSTWIRRIFIRVDFGYDEVLFGDDTGVAELRHASRSTGTISTAQLSFSTQPNKS
jgi:hypothetical protein